MKKSRTKLLSLLLWGFLLLGSTAVFAQERIITGTVIDGVLNEPLIGGTVNVKGTTKGVITDMEGKYEISVNGNNDTLVFSFVGLSTMEEAVGSRTVVDVTMIMDLTELQEVVVIGCRA